MTAAFDPSPAEAPPPSADLLPRATRRALPIALLKAREALMAHFRPMLARHDLTEQQWRTLRALVEATPLDAGALAARAFLLGPSLTRIVQALEARGLVRRQTDARDARRSKIAITAKGRALVERVRPESQAIYDMLEARFGAERIEALLVLLEELSAVGAGLGAQDGDGA